MSNAFDKIAAGLNEVIDFGQGKETGARFHQVEAPTVDAPYRDATAMNAGRSHIDCASGDSTRCSCKTKKLVSRRGP